MSELSTTIRESAATLRANLGALNESDQKFAGSLLDQFAKRGLSEKQLFWVNKLAERAVSPATEAEKAPVFVGSFAGVIELFATARKHLKFPKIRLATEDGRPVALSVAGERARCPGSVNVTDGGSYGNNVWYGRVMPNGAWEKGGAVNSEVEGKVSKLLCELASDPAGTAAKFGRLTGNCCFCNTELTDARSTSVGYGPICAKHFGLPWGAK